LEPLINLRATLTPSRANRGPKNPGRSLSVRLREFPSSATIHADRTVECEANWEVAAMKTLISISALCLFSSLAVGTAFAQPYAPNEAGVTMGHWHLNSRDVAANKKIFLGMGGVDTSNSRIQSVTFPGVVVNLNAPGATAPPTGGSVGSVVNHVGFIVKNVPESVAKWKPRAFRSCPAITTGWIRPTSRHQMA
jgi:hypothetical protein